MVFNKRNLQSTAVSESGREETIQTNGGGGYLRMMPVRAGDRLTLVLVGLEGLTSWLCPHPKCVTEVVR